MNKIESARQLHELVQAADEKITALDKLNEIRAICTHVQESIADGRHTGFSTVEVEEIILSIEEIIYRV
jgi:hypothetical protein